MSNVCHICGAVPECFVRSYNSKPFVDGKQHDIMCFLCASIPNTYEYHEDQGIVCYKHKSPFYLNNASYLIGEGWKPVEIDRSIKALNKKVEHLVNIEPIHNAIFEVLYLSDEVEIDTTDMNDIKLIYR